ncbi:MAG: DUF5320 domain-containing protein [Anaerolineae bacterium]|nr:DUF5320 domain-containing protein [Anaerolineae bacterium]
MPWGDGTGPAGLGPMTGRGAGYCAGYPVPGYMNPWPRLGMGWGWRGGGHGWRNMYYATGLPGWLRFGYGYTGYAVPLRPPATYWGWGAGLSKEQQAEALKAQAEWLQQQLELINKRLDELSSEETPEE